MSGDGERWDTGLADTWHLFSTVNIGKGKKEPETSLITADKQFRKLKHFGAWQLLEAENCEELPVLLCLKGICQSVCSQWNFAYPVAYLCSWSEERAHPSCHWFTTAGPAQALEEQLSLQHP